VGVCDDYQAGGARALDILLDADDAARLSGWLIEHQAGQPTVEVR
jgi:hypothetical protein